MQIGLGASLRSPRNLSIGQKAVSILKKYGNDAHIYLPGIGTLSGLQAGNYLDSAGTTLGTVDNPVGLVLDAAGSVGSELVTNGDFSNGTTGYIIVGGAPTAGTAVVGGALELTATGGSYPAVRQAITTVVGKTYQISVTARRGTTASNVSMTAGAVSVESSATTDAQILFYYVAVSTSTNVQAGIASGTANGTAYFDNISVKEVTGIHATQPTTAAKPTLRLTSGRYSWAFDGGDSLSLGSVPFQMSDDICVIAAAASTLTAAERTIFSVSGASTNNPLCPNMVYGSDGRYKAYWRGDSGVLDQAGQTGTVQTLASMHIVTAIKVGASKTLRVDSVLQSGAGGTNLGATNLTAATIGANVNAAGAASAILQGSTGPIIAIKGTLSDADLLTLERLVSSLTPNGPSF
jgi:hypothetical protein